MVYSIDYKDFGDFVSTKNETIIFPKDRGTLQTDSIVINEYITINRNNFNMKEDIEIKYDFELSGISININLESEYFYKSNIYPFSINRKEHTTLISLISQEQGDALYLKDKNIKNIIIFVKMEFLRKILNTEKYKNILLHLEKQKEIKAIKEDITHIKTKLCAYEIYNTRCNTALDQVFIQSKVLEILSCEFSNLIDQNEIFSNNMSNYSEYDIKALHQAKEILVNNMINPPSIMQLSKLIKLNEFKLKYGFKMLFKVSPYSFLLEHKLHKAKELLESGNLNVNETAFEIGYKRVHSFSDAFYKRFGVRPKDIMKNRKYY